MSLCRSPHSADRSGVVHRRPAHLQHVPVLLKCYEQVQGQHYCYITKSNWLENARDTTLCLK